VRQDAVKILMCQLAARWTLARIELSFFRASLPQDTTEWVDAFRDLFVAGSSSPRSRKRFCRASSASLTLRRRAMPSRLRRVPTSKTMGRRAVRASTRKTLARSASSSPVRSPPRPIGRRRRLRAQSPSMLSAVSRSSQSGWLTALQASPGRHPHRRNPIA